MLRKSYAHGKTTLISRWVDFSSHASPCYVLNSLHGKQFIRKSINNIIFWKSVIPAHFIKITIGKKKEKHTPLLMKLQQPTTPIIQGNMFYTLIETRRTQHKKVNVLFSSDGFTFYGCFIIF